MGAGGAIALDGIIGAGLGLATASWNDQRQVDQQRQLQNLAIEGQQQMGEFNEGLAIDQWEKTGPVGQMAQLQKAGLNPGLMYSGGGGGGGTLQQPNNGQIGIADAPKGGGEILAGAGLGIQTELQQATKENIKADTKKKEVEATKIGGVDTQAAQAGISETMAQIKKIGADTQNAEVTNGILQYEKTIKEAEANVATQTQQATIAMAGKSLESLSQTIQQQVTQNKITKETADNLIQQAAQNTIEQQLRMGAIKAGIINTEANTVNTNENTKVQKQQIDNMKQVIMNLEAEYSATKQGQTRAWEQLGINEQEMEIKKQLMQFGTNEAAHVKQWTSIITDVIEAIGIGKYLKGAAPAAGAGRAIRDANGRTQPRGWTDTIK